MNIRDTFSPWEPGYFAMQRDEAILEVVMGRAKPTTDIMADFRRVVDKTDRIIINMTGKNYADIRNRR